MPETSAQIYQRLMGLNDQMKALPYMSVDDTNKQLLAKVDNFRPQWQALHDAEAKAYAAPAQVFKSYQDLFGDNQMTGPSAMSRFATAMGDIGHNFATAGTLGDVINTQGGNIANVAKSIVDINNQNRQGIQDQVSFWTPFYQQALQAEEAKRARDAAAAQLASYKKLMNPTPATPAGNPAQTDPTASLPVGVPTQINGKWVVKDAAGNISYTSPPQETSQDFFGNIGSGIDRTYRNSAGEGKVNSALNSFESSGGLSNPIVSAFNFWKGLFG